MYNQYFAWFNHALSEFRQKSIRSYYFDVFSRIKPASKVNACIFKTFPSTFQKILCIYMYISCVIPFNWLHNSYTTKSFLEDSSTLNNICFPHQVTKLVRNSNNGRDDEISTDFCTVKGISIIGTRWWWWVWRISRSILISDGLYSWSDDSCCLQVYSLPLNRLLYVLLEKLSHCSLVKGRSREKVTRFS